MKDLIEDACNGLAISDIARTYTRTWEDDCSRKRGWNRRPERVGFDPTPDQQADIARWRNVMGYRWCYIGMRFGLSGETVSRWWRGRDEGA